MALGASGLAASGAYGGVVQAALLRARLTGQPVQIPGSTLVASPNGNIGTPGGGFGGSASQPVQQPVVPSSPFNTAGVAGLPGSPSGPAVAPPQQPPASPPSWWQQGINALVPASPAGYMPPPPAGVGPQPPLNQANPNFTAGIPGLAGGPSGAAVAPPGGFQPPSVVPPTQLPDVTVSARRYRAQHGLAADDDSAATDRLNAASLAAAQAGRTYMQPGPYPAGDNVVANALVAPPTSQAPIMLAPTAVQPQQQITPAQGAALWQRIQQMQPPQNTQAVTGQQVQNLLQQGLY